MASTLRVGLLLDTTMILAAAAAPALAQTTPAPAEAKAGAADSNAGDIIVTARRTEERLQDVPISITVLSQDALTKRDIYNATDLAIYVPSLSSNANFGPEKSSFSIRGFTQEGKTAPSVAVYFADVVAPRANGGTTSGNGAGPGSMFDLQDVQVLKGPQGTLFGRNTTGGAILLVPAKPTDKFQGSLEGSVGDYNMHRVQGMLNVPLSDNFRVRGAFDWNQRDGYLNNVSGIGPDKFGNTNYFAGRLSMVGDLTPNLENYTIFSYSRSNDNGVVPNLLVCNNGSNPSQPLLGLTTITGPAACNQIAQQKANGGNFYTVNSTDPHPYERVTQWQVINTTTWKESDTLTVKNIISYAEYYEASSFSLWGTNLQLNPAPGYTIPVPTIQLDPGPSGYNAAESTFTEEFQLQGRTANDRLHWQAGLYLELSNPLGYSSGAASIFANCPNAVALQCSNPLGFGTVSDYSIKDYFNDKGIYAQIDYKLTDRLILTGGIRYTHDYLKDDDINTDGIPNATGTGGTYYCQNILAYPNKMVANSLSPGCFIETTQSTGRPTWLLNAQYDISHDAMVYAKWARGYREGGINPNNLGFPSWGPEKVDTYEAGSKFSWHGAMPGFFNFAAFYNNFTAQQLSVNAVIAPAYAGVVPPQQLILNAGKSRIFGAEVDAAIRPFEGFHLDLSYAYLNTKLESFNPPAPPVYFSSLTAAAQVGGPLELSPKNKVTLTGTYTLPLDRSYGEVSLGATFTHTDANRAVAPITSPYLYEIPATDDLNINVDWKGVFGRPLDLSFFMTNVTNEHHILFPDGAYTTIGAEGGHPNLPRMFGLRAKVHFGD
ncbi:MAG: TonB-dependent receptor [Sphingomonadales bacterium]|nr:TonB-dependent receptor [Sphingomonadales bacterium]